MDLTHDFGESLNKKMTAKGVLDVTIKSSLKKITTVDAWQEARDEAEEILDCKVPEGCGFDFVAILLEGCYKDDSCRFAAYACKSLKVFIGRILASLKHSQYFLLQTSTGFIASLLMIKMQIQSLTLVSDSTNAMNVPSSSAL
jgi:hypothetical protein